MKPEVSVVMAVYNKKEEHLREAIESILFQTFSNFEFIIVVDNPQNDRIKNIVREYKKKDKRIKVLTNKRNMDLAFSLNKAIKNSKGEFIMRMDGDDISLPQRMDLQVEYLKKNENVDLLFGWAKIIDENGDLLYDFKPRRNLLKI